MAKSLGSGGRQPMDLARAQVPLGRVHVIAERLHDETARLGALVTRSRDFC